MSNLKQNFRSPFFSALLGGLVVAVFGWIAIAAGWIESDGGSTTTVAAPLTAPVKDSSGDGDTNVVNQIYKADGDGVAFIESQIEAPETESFNPFGEVEPEGGGSATGSGFVIDDEGHVLTNNHVIEGAGKVTVKLGDSETTYDAEVVGADPGTDVALLKVDAPKSAFHPLTLGRSAEMEVGDPVVAIGNPFDLQRTVTSGIVSALQREIQAPDGVTIDNVIQTDAAINPGNSGGPLINAGGEVIGINSQIYTGGEGSDGNVGIGFAIPINTAKEEIAKLESGTADEHGYLGITGANVTPELARAFNLPVEEGVLVQQVVEGGPAAAAGIQGATTAAEVEGQEFGLGGDIITAIDGKQITSITDLQSAIQGHRSGDVVKLTVARSGGQKTDLSVTLGTQPTSAQG